MPQPPGTGTAADGLTRHRLRFDSLAALGRSATGTIPVPERGGAESKGTLIRLRFDSSLRSSLSDRDSPGP